VVVKPLFKKGDKTGVTNYRPVSLLCFSQVLEKAIHSALSRHLHSNKQVTEEHGFDKEIYTENAAFRVTDTVLKSINQKMHVGGTFCDLMKAFDNRNHGFF
jgi:hypothetical protein